jgi:hypothetical protein
MTKLLIVPTKNLTDSARKEYREKICYNMIKKRIFIGHQYSRQFEIKEVLMVLRSRIINK